MVTHEYLESLLDLMADQEVSDAFLHQDKIPRLRQKGSVISSEYAACPAPVFDLLAIKSLIRENRTEELRDHLQKQDQTNQSSLLNHLTPLNRDRWIDEATGKQILTTPQGFLRAMKGFR